MLTEKQLKEWDKAAHEYYSNEITFQVQAMLACDHSVACYPGPLHLFNKRENLEASG